MIVVRVLWEVWDMGELLQPASRKGVGRLLRVSMLGKNALPVCGRGRLSVPPAIAGGSSRTLSVSVTHPLSQVVLTGSTRESRRLAAKEAAEPTDANFYASPNRGLIRTDHRLHMRRAFPDCSGSRIDYRQHSSPGCHSWEVLPDCRRTGPPQRLHLHAR